MAQLKDTSINGNATVSGTLLIGSNKLNVKEQIDNINNNLINDVVSFPDYTKELAYYENQGFTAPQNCWARFDITSGWTNSKIYINSIMVFVQQIRNTDDYPIRTSSMLPLKKDDIVTITSKTSVNGIKITLYDMKC